MEVNPERVFTTVTFVILLEFRTQPPRLDPYDRVGSGIEGGRPVKYLHPGNGFFDRIFLGLNRLFGREAQESNHTVRADETRTGQNSLKLRSDCFCRNVSGCL